MKPAENFTRGVREGRSSHHSLFASSSLSYPIHASTPCSCLYLFSLLACLSSTCPSSICVPIIESAHFPRHLRTTFAIRSAAKMAALNFHSLPPFLSKLRVTAIFPLFKRPSILADAFAKIHRYFYDLR